MENQSNQQGEMVNKQTMSKTLRKKKIPVSGTIEFQSS
jgi:hypothetical protein